MGILLSGGGGPHPGTKGRINNQKILLQKGDVKLGGRRGEGTKGRWEQQWTAVIRTCCKNGSQDFEQVSKTIIFKILEVTES